MNLFHYERLQSVQIFLLYSAANIGNDFELQINLVFFFERCLVCYELLLNYFISRDCLMFFLIDTLTIVRYKLKRLLLKS
jgi:hypothetical protein